MPAHMSILELGSNCARYDQCICLHVLLATLAGVCACHGAGAPEEAGVHEVAATLGFGEEEDVYGGQGEAMDESSWSEARWDFAWHLGRSLPGCHRHFLAEGEGARQQAAGPAYSS